MEKKKSNSGVTVLIGEKTRLDIKRMVGDPVLIEMLHELFDSGVQVKLVAEDQNFRTHLNDEYTKRGGHYRTIGGPLTALLEINECIEDILLNSD